MNYLKKASLGIEQNESTLCKVPFDLGSYLGKKINSYLPTAREGCVFRGVCLFRSGWGSRVSQVPYLFWVGAGGRVSLVPCPFWGVYLGGSVSGELGYVGVRVSGG